MDKKQLRSSNGRFAPICATEGKRAPRDMDTPALPLPERFSGSIGFISAVQSPSPATKFEPLEDGDAQRFVLAMMSAIRTPHSPADRAAVTAERRALEARFGAIDWAA